MKTAKKLFALAIASTMMLPLAACGGTGGNGGDGGYRDTIERPEIEAPEVPVQVVYPEKPATAPVTPAEGTKPSVKAYGVSQTDSTYTVESADGVTHVSYTGVSDWSYLYASVENYSSKYGNIKITVRNGNPSAERIAVQAVYYESYDLGYAPVTVYLGEMAEGEQYVIAELGQNLITDGAYQPVKGESVRNKTIIGFVIFVDSLPSFAPTTDANGAFDIVKFEFLEDGDPALEDRYVKPVADLSAATQEGGSKVIPVTKYSADYTKYTLGLNGTAGAEVDLAVRYTLGGKTEVSPAKRVTLTGADQTVEYDFASLRPLTGGNDFTSQYIKNGEITAIVVTPVADAEVTIAEAAFVRTATDGAYVSDVWNSAASDVNIVRAANGGNAKIEHAFYTSWYNFSVSVRKGAGVNKIRFTIYAPDGLTHLGIGITNNSMLSSNGQNAGTYILRGASYVFNGAASDKIGTDGKLGSGEPNLEGLVETIAYDEESKIYTITYDFSGIQNNNFAEYTLTSLIFYLNCPDTEDTLKEHTFSGTRSLYFLSIDLFAE